MAEEQDMSADKEQATRLADALRQSFPAFGDGTRSDRERLAVDAAALLERWPDAVEPVARVSWNDIGHISWRTNVMLPDGTPLYTAPAAQPVKPGGEPVASMIRHRAGTPASRAWDGKVHWHEWSEWSPATLAHGRAVTDPSRNPTEDSEWQMQPLYAAQPDQSARIADRKWLDNECLDGGCQSLKWHERIAALEAALGELVALKDLKERIEAADASTYSLSDASAAQALADEYDLRKAPAWQAARAAYAARGKT